MPTQTRKITVDTAILFIGKILGLIAGMVRLNYLASNLGVTNFGILNFALYFCSLFQMFFEFGSSQLLTRDLARDLSRSQEYVGKISILKVLVAFATSAIIGTIGLCSHFDKITNWAILLTTIVFAINGLSMVFLSAFQAHRKMTIVSLYNILNDVLLSILIITFIAGHPYVNTVLTLNIVVAVINLALLFFMYKKIVGLPQFLIDLPLWKSFSKVSIPFTLGSVGVSLYTFIGVTVLKYSHGDTEVGLYSSAYKLVATTLLIPMVFSQVIYPVISEFFVSAKAKLEKSLTDSLRMLSNLSFPLVVGTILLAPKIYSLLYTPAFSQGILILQVMIGAILFSYMNYVLYSFLLAVNQQKFCMVSTLCVGATIVILSLILIPRYGYIVLPILSILTEGTMFTLEIIFLRSIGYKQIRFGFLAPPIASTVLMGAGLYFLRNLSLAISVPAGIFIYFLSLFLMNGFGDQEKEVFNKIRARFLSN